MYKDHNNIIDHCRVMADVSFKTLLLIVYTFPHLTVTYIILINCLKRHISLYVQLHPLGDPVKPR